MKTVIIFSALTIIGIQAQGGKDGGKGGAKGGNSGIMSALGGLFGESGVPLGPAPKGCVAYEVMYARGTFEPGPFGLIVGDPLNTAVKRDMHNEDVRGYAVQYPAKMGGADIGVTDIVNRVTTKAKECPKMKFALVGYSQGGGVVSSAFPRIPQELRGNIVAMVLYGAGKGDGAGFGGPPKGAGEGKGMAGPPGDGKGKGMGLGGSGPLSSDIKEKTLANCAPGDMCNPQQGQGQTAFTGHLSYANAGTQWHSRSAKYIAASFHGKSPGYKLEMNP